MKYLPFSMTNRGHPESYLQLPPLSKLVHTWSLKLILISLVEVLEIILFDQIPRTFMVTYHFYICFHWFNCNFSDATSHNDLSPSNSSIFPNEWITCIYWKTNWVYWRVEKHWVWVWKCNNANITCIVIASSFLVIRENFVFWSCDRIMFWVMDSIRSQNYVYITNHIHKAASRSQYMPVWDECSATRRPRLSVKVG